MKTEFYQHRDINWLLFNERVLLEAKDETTPLLERLKFLAIFSANLDEYFKVRISQLRQLKKVDKSLRKKLLLRPNKKLGYILDTVDKQQQHFGQILGDILQSLERHNIFFPKPVGLTSEQKAFLKTYFTEKLQGNLEVQKWAHTPQLKDGYLYLLVQSQKEVLGLVRIPTEKHGRFIRVPGPGATLVFLEDVIRANIDLLFPGKAVHGSYAVKLSRDAELYLEDDYGNTALVEHIYDSLGQREYGQPTRLLYDPEMPKETRMAVQNRLGVGEVDMFPGGRYHNLSDFFGLGNPTDDPKLVYPPKAPLPHPVLSKTKDFFASISKKDQLVHFPY
ncbi:MAG: polyphosphate kinase 1, partial [Bacteroidota bacterium]